MLQAIIKVGKSSDVKFNNVQAYRAINYREVERLLSKNTDISFVVFEEVKDEDASRIKNIAKSFNIISIIYNKGGSSDIIDEIGVRTVGNLQDLQVYVESRLGESITTFKQEEIKDTNDIENDTFDASTDNVDFSESNKDNKDINENENKGSDIEDETIFIDETDDMEDIKSELAEALQASNDNFDKEEVVEVIQNADIMSKEDIVSDIDDFEGLFNSLEDDTQVDTLDDIEKNQKYEKEIDGITTQLKYALDNVRNLSELGVHLEDELKQYKDFIERMQTSETIVEVTTNYASKIELENKLDELQGLVNTLQLEVDETHSLEEQIKGLETKLIDKDELAKEIQSKLDNATSNEVLTTLNNRMRLEVEARLFVTQSLLAMHNELISTQDALSKKLQEVGALLKEYKKLEIEVTDLDIEKTELERTKLESENTLNEQIKVLTDKIANMTVEIDESKQTILEQTIQIGTAESSLESLSTELEATRQSLKDTKQRLESESLEVHRFQQMGAEELDENMKALEESNSTLAIEIGRLRRDKDDLQRQLENKDKDVSTLSEQVRVLSTTAKALTRTVDAGETIKITCNYTGRAFIIPVYGSGSFGITSTAVSLANALDGKVLIMDFDIVNPKVDTWYNKNPIIRSLPDISNNMKKTGLGALIEKGTDYVIDHKDELISTVVQTKGAEHKVDYFSGAYTKINMFKLMAVDFSELLTYFGHEYDYIVVDLGRIGGSEITNALIRMFNEVSVKNIIVGLHDGSDCRTLTLRVQSENIDRGKSIWVLNLAKSDKIDNLIKESISTSKYVVFFRDMKIYGERVPYNKVGILKDRLSKLVELILQ